MNIFEQVEKIDTKMQEKKEEKKVADGDNTQLSTTVSGSAGGMGFTHVSSNGAGGYLISGGSGGITSMSPDGHGGFYIH